MAVAAAFLALLVVKAFFHEPWRDELGVHGLIRASRSLAELRENLRYSGHPLLWPLLSYAVTGLSPALLAAQLLNAAFAAGGVWVFARYAALGRREKVLFALGYFPLFEYGTIARDYALGMALAFAACALLGARPRRPLLLALVLVLLSNTSVYGGIIAGAIGLAALVELRGEVPPARLAAAALIFAAGVGVAAVCMKPPPGTGHAIDWRTQFDLREAGIAAGHVARAFFPIPRQSFQFWNTSIFDSHGKLGALTAAAILGAATLGLLRSRAALAILLSGTGAHLLFAYVKYGGVMRHHGHFFIVFLAACWVSGLFRERWRARLLAAVLAVHAAVGLFASGIDIARPFSASGAAARFIEERGLRDLPLVGDRDSVAVSVAVLLDRPMTFPASGRTAKFVTWDLFRFRATSGEVLEAARRRAAETRSDVLIVLNYALDARDDRVEAAGSFVESVVADETYHLYLYRYRP